MTTNVEFFFFFFGTNIEQFLYKKKKKKKKWQIFDECKTSFHSDTKIITIASNCLKKILQSNKDISTNEFSGNRRLDLIKTIIAQLSKICSIFSIVWSARTRGNLSNNSSKQASSRERNSPHGIGPLFLARVRGSPRLRFHRVTTHSLFPSLSLSRSTAAREAKKERLVTDNNRVRSFEVIARCKRWGKRRRRRRRRRRKSFSAASFLASGREISASLFFLEDFVNFWKNWRNVKSLERKVRENYDCIGSCIENGQAFIFLFDTLRRSHISKRFLKLFLSFREISQGRTFHSYFAVFKKRRICDPFFLITNFPST